MARQIDKIFAIQLILFTISIFLVSAAVFLIESERNIEQRVSERLRNDLQLWAHELNYKIMMAEENVNALSSRTMIRTRLYEYHEGNTNIEEVRAFTQSKFADGASVYNDILYAFRKDMNNNEIANYFNSLPGKEIEQPGVFVFFQSENGCNVLVRKPIYHEGVEIGMDTAAFFLADMTDLPSAFIAFACIKPAVDVSSVGENEYINPLGDTGYVLYGELNSQVLKSERLNALKAVFLQTFILLAAVFAVSYFTIFRLTFELIRDLRMSNSEKDLLFKELQHRIRNNLSFIISYINLRQKDTDSNLMIDRDEKLIRKIEAMSIAYDMLQNSGEFSELVIGDYLEQLCTTVVRSGYAEGVELQTDIRDVIKVASKTAITLGLIYSELIINSLKHAKDKAQMIITLGVSRNDEGIFFLYSDNGKPYPKDFDLKSSSSLGFLVIVSLVEQIGGRLETDFKNSKEVRIIIEDQ